MWIYAWIAAGSSERKGPIAFGSKCNVSVHLGWCGWLVKGEHFQIMCIWECYPGEEPVTPSLLAKEGKELWEGLVFIKNFLETLLS